MAVRTLGVCLSKHVGSMASRVASRLRTVPTQRAPFEVFACVTQVAQATRNTANCARDAMDPAARYYINLAHSYWPGLFENAPAGFSCHARITMLSY